MSPVLEGVGLALFLAANLLALVMIPLGLPGTFVQVGAALAVTVLSDGARLGWTWVFVFLALALLGELVEFLSGQWGARRFGGSRRAAWGALVGGMVGAFVGGIPVPVVGALVMSFVGTFVGALVGEMSARGTAAPDLRVGAGAIVGRVVGVATKLSLAFVMLVLASTVLGAQWLARRGPA
jgi:uncharacterized protein YqgC (DUF456 family)